MFNKIKNALDRQMQKFSEKITQASNWLTNKAEVLATIAYDALNWCQHQAGKLLSAMWQLLKDLPQRLTLLLNQLGAVLNKALQLGRWFFRKSWDLLSKLGNLTKYLLIELAQDLYKLCRYLAQQLLTLGKHIYHAFRYILVRIPSFLKTLAELGLELLSLLKNFLGSVCKKLLTFSFQWGKWILKNVLLETVFYGMCLVSMPFLMLLKKLPLTEFTRVAMSIVLGSVSAVGAVYFGFNYLAVGGVVMGLGITYRIIEALEANASAPENEEVPATREAQEERSKPEEIVDDGMGLAPLFLPQFKNRESEGRRSREQPQVDDQILEEDLRQLAARL